MIQYIINGTNLYTSCGFISGPGRESSDSFLADNDPKEGYSHDWGDENGIEYDLASPVRVKPRVFLIEGYIRANGESDFMGKWEALKSLVKSQPYLAITMNMGEVTVSVGAKFKNWTKFKRLAVLTGNGIKSEVGMQFDEVINDSINNSMGVDITVESVSALNMIISNEKAGVLYKYWVKHDEEQGGSPSLRMRCDGDYVFNVRTEATV